MIPKHRPTRKRSVWMQRNWKTQYLSPMKKLNSLEQIPLFQTMLQEKQFLPSPDFLRPEPAPQEQTVLLSQ